MEEQAVSNVEWRRWGDSDPFWGVAAWAGRDRGGDNPWTPEEFYELGRTDWEDFYDRWRRYGVDTGTCVEIGCGAGRLTKHMAETFDRVIGVDVSEGMIRTAKEHLSSADIDFRLGGGLELPVDSGTADGVFSSHVFQHFDSLAIARRNFADIARVLKPGGTVMVHLPVYMPPDGLPMLAPLMAVRRKGGDVRAWLRRRRGKPLMRGLQYSWNWLSDELPAVGLTDVELWSFAVRSNASAHSFVLARRAG